MDHNLSKKERQELQLQKQREQAEEARRKREEEFAKHQDSKSKRTRLYAISAAVIIIIVFGGLAYFIYAAKLRPGPYDDFAKCLTQKGAIMYGAISWCHFTQEQAGMFGNSFKYVNYKDYKDTTGITVTPTWDISGQRYEKVQSFERLAQLTGCQLPAA